MVHLDKFMVYGATFLWFVIFSASALASTTLDFHGVYKQPDNEDYYQRADVVAIIKTLSGKIIPTEKEGKDETKVVSKVLVPIKGTQQATELTIYGGASEINAEYMAILKWDEMIEGYRFLSHDMSHSIDKIYEPELVIPVTKKLSEQKIATINALNARSLSVIEDWVKEMFGFQSEVVVHNGWIYLPTCEVRFQKNCERDFKRLQFMLKKIK